VSDKTDIQNVQSSGSQGLELRTTALGALYQILWYMKIMSFSMVAF